MIRIYMPELLTRSIVDAGKLEVPKTRDSAFTEVSPELVGSTAINAER